MSFAAVQKHVAVLEEAGLLTKRRNGREQLASGDVSAVRSVASMLTELEQVWREVYADPRQLERVWGPPTCPATFVDHSLTPGGRMTYFMTGPEGEEYAGYWRSPPSTSPGASRSTTGSPTRTSPPNIDLPVSRSVYTFTEHQGGTRAVYVSTYASADALQQVLDMGVVEGASSAINQVDGLIAA